VNDTSRKMPFRRACAEFYKEVFMVITVHQLYQLLYYPTNAHNVKTQSY